MPAQGLPAGPRRDDLLLGLGARARPAAGRALLGGRLLLRRRRCPRPSPRRAVAARLAVLAHRVEAGLQGAHQVGHRRGGVLGRPAGRRSPRRPPCARSARGPPRGRRRGTSRARSGRPATRRAAWRSPARGPGRLDLVGVGHVVELLRVDDLVGEDHRRHAQDVVVHRAQRDEVLLRADDDAGDRRPCPSRASPRAAAGRAWRRRARARGSRGGRRRSGRSRRGRRSPRSRWSSSSWDRAPRAPRSMMTT